DMGEKLGGDYLFDIVYVENAYAQLSDELTHSMQRFNLLTENRYPVLHSVYDRIDTQIREMIYGSPPGQDRMVVFLSDTTRDMVHTVGGKFASLAEVKNSLSLRVPEAFVITTRAFDTFISSQNLTLLVESLDNGTGVKEPVLDEVRDLIVHATIPQELEEALHSALENLKTKCGEHCFLAVRSSAEDEDGESSFAGQFETVLNVPLELRALEDAYRKVVASLFSHQSVNYQKQLGYRIGKLKMAVGCMVMVDALASGVIYSTSPNEDTDTLLINATWGLGKAIVEGQTDGDFYKVKKGVLPELVEVKKGKKERMIVTLAEGGTDTIRTPETMAGKSCLAGENVQELSRIGMILEGHFERPQDIEWAIDRDERIYVVQSRPLMIEQKDWSEPTTPVSLKDIGPPLMSHKGIAVQKGVGVGRVFILRHADEIGNVPRGAVLVSRYDSSSFVRIMPYLAAIVTDVGTPTSHMASLCREFRIPTIVNTGKATEILSHGQAVTVTVGDEGDTVVYEGAVRGLENRADRHSERIEQVYEFRKKRYILRYIVPLNLIDPSIDQFLPERCKTLHDVLRFIHEKSVMELVDKARYGNAMIKEHAAVKLELPVPAGIIVIDIGGGLNSTAGSEHASFEQIASLPLRAVIKGMIHPGVWHADAVSMKVNDFLSSMIRVPEIAFQRNDYVGYNVAVASAEYTNLNLKFGYHFTVIDCYCSETARNNHLYFRFMGGATDITKRSRRVQLIAEILKGYGLTIETKGDLIIGRIGNMRRDAMEAILEQMGRLLAYTRQLDAVMHDDFAVERYVRNFLKGNYEL
ncbi:MAG TPA: PEP/pyruvate-binding domain-containing protein, partial [Thermodesulfovibrionales bacterium]|nr:PEP/pyruvate-binding domain-containing protein [Thermodesulfovibrionales bacterium]